MPEDLDVEVAGVAVGTRLGGISGGVSAADVSATGEGWEGRGNG